MKFDAVIFDCDGILVDSEPITLGVLRDMLSELGWELSPQQCHALFVGKAFQDEMALIQENTGKKLGPEWIDVFRARRNSALISGLEAVPGIHDALAAIAGHWQANIACASGADRKKIELQLDKIRIRHFFGDRIFSGHEVARNKPFPDIYQAASAALGVSAQRCAVIEDSVTGIAAGVAAGAMVFAYSPLGLDEPLYNAGASKTFSSMALLPDLLI
ncbi:MAG: HAD-IA family hydrolase [Paralcaligenes sp.]